MQIDVKGIISSVTFNEVAQCNLYTSERCVTIYMPKWQYEELIRDGFFIRDGKEVDSANVLNTTEVYELRKEDKNE